MQSTQTRKNKRLRILCVGAFPPPVSGQSLAMQLLWDGLSKRHDLERYDISDPLERVSHIVAARRMLRLGLTSARAISSLSKRGRSCTVLYIQLGQSSRAMVRDLPVLSWAVGARVPIVGHIHGSQYASGFAEAPNCIQRVMRSIMRSVKVVVLSESLLTTVTSVVSPRSVEPVANGVDPALSRAAKSAEPRTLSPNTPVRALFLGNLIQEKGYIEALQVARRAHEQSLHVELTIAGFTTSHMSVDPREFIARHQLPNARYIGPVNRQQKIDLLKRSDVLLFPSVYRTEGQPLVILEAMHFGLPVLAYPVGDVQHMLGPSAEGLLMDPDRDGPTQMLSRLQDMVRNPEVYNEVSSALLARARRLYSAEAHIAQIERVLLEAADCASEEEHQWGGDSGSKS